MFEALQEVDAAARNMKAVLDALQAHKAKVKPHSLLQLTILCDLMRRTVEDCVTGYPRSAMTQATIDLSAQIAS